MLLYELLLLKVVNHHMVLFLNNEMFSLFLNQKLFIILFLKIINL